MTSINKRIFYFSRESIARQTKHVKRLLTLESIPKRLKSGKKIYRGSVFRVLDFGLISRLVQSGPPVITVLEMSQNKVGSSADDAFYSVDFVYQEFV